MAERTSELFAISAVILLGLALFDRFIPSTALGISISWHGKGYVFSPALICMAMATTFCLFATIYSLWMLPFNRTAMLWHFWLTGIGIAVFWVAFYGSASTLPGSRTATWAVFITPVVLLLVQIIFLWNFIHAMFKASRMHS